jgi:lipoprotein-anchoring transpeptidase ErfK/SrfK
MRLVGLVSVTALAAACSSGGSGGGGGGEDKKEPAAPVVAITPADGTGKAAPEKGVEVKATLGKLTAVKVTLKGKNVPGELSADQKSWKSAWTLTPSSSYSVEATAENEGKTAVTTSKFKTLKAKKTIGLSLNYPIMPYEGQTVGVGMPINVNFSEPVTDRKAAERSLEVHSKYPNEGAWYWYSDRQVIFRTKKYWKANQPITVTGHFAGVKFGKDTYGVKDFKVKFRVGDEIISNVNTRTHRMTVKINGKKVRDVGISAGKGTEYKYKTTSGIHLTMEKENPVTMISPGIKEGEPGYYKEVVNSAVRISNSGEYVHSAPWSVGVQGSANVSHGCVNASPSFASWFYNKSHWGDIVIVKGTDRELEFDNGYGWWQKPWKQWVLGSAFDRTIKTAAPKEKLSASATPSATPTATDSATPSATSSVTGTGTPSVTPTATPTP